MNPQTTFKIDVKTHQDLLNYAFVCGLSVIYPAGKDYINCSDGTRIGLVYFFSKDDNVNLDDYLAMDISKKYNYFLDHPWIEYSFTIMNETQIIGRMYLNSSAIVNKGNKEIMKNKYRVMKVWIKKRCSIIHTV